MTAFQFCALLLTLFVFASALPAEPGEAHWRTLTIRSQQEFEAGLPGGEAEQWMHDITRSQSKPDRLYMAHDVGKVWRSEDNGRTWQHAICNGLEVPCMQSIEVDPVNADVVMALASSAWDRRSDDLHGLYRSEDAGLNWTLVLPLPGNAERLGVLHLRYIQRNITWDPTTVTDTEAQRWYAGVNQRDLYRSEDGGRSWSKVHALEPYGHLNGVHAHPSRPRTIYLCTAKGLLRSEDGGDTLAPLGDLPEGRVRNIDINPANPADIYATVDGKGLFRSLDEGKTFNLVHSFNARRVQVHPTQRNLIYLVGPNGTHMIVSSDGGETWNSPEVNLFPGRKPGGWKSRLCSDFCIVLPDPRDPDSAIVQSAGTIYRTEDGGASFMETGYTGYAWGWYTPSVAFDPVDPDRIAFFMKDVGVQYTTTGGDWFMHRGVPGTWKAQGHIAHTCMNTGAMQPTPGSEVIVATAGIYWREVLVRSEDAGKNWQIIDPQPAQNLFVAFHPADPNIVYAHNKRSDDAGKTFRVLETLPDTAVILGMAPTNGDIVYAMNAARTELHRSDDRGETWRLYSKPGWPMRGLDPIPTFAVHPTNPDLVYSIDRQGDLASFDGATWKSLGVRASASGQPNPRGYVRYVALDPRHTEIIYASGYQSIYRSTDAGATWSDISGNLPRLSGSIAVHPLTGDLLWGSITGTRVLAPPYESPKALYHKLK